jgi:hypothetical protein
MRLLVLVALLAVVGDVQTGDFGFRIGTEA